MCMGDRSSRDGGDSGAKIPVTPAPDTGGPSGSHTTSRASISATDSFMVYGGVAADGTGGAGGGAVGGGMNAGAWARKPLPAAAAGGGGGWPAPSCPVLADHVAALPQGEAPSMHWRPPCPNRGGDQHPGARRSRSLLTH